MAVGCERHPFAVPSTMGQWRSLYLHLNKPSAVLSLSRALSLSLSAWLVCGSYDGGKPSEASSPTFANALQRVKGRRGTFVKFSGSRAVCNEHIGDFFPNMFSAWFPSGHCLDPLPRRPSTLGPNFNPSCVFAPKTLNLHTPKP